MMVGGRKWGAIRSWQIGTFASVPNGPFDPASTRKELGGTERSRRFDPVSGSELAYMMLIQGLRLDLAEGLRGRVGWLFALSDKQMTVAITSMHDESANDWTVENLAERAGMSRSTFALRFKQTVGVSPMEYLTCRRMLLVSCGQNRAYH
jgi:Bacterial regulatory helix-turn-helix proteins, AraC family